MQDLNERALTAARHDAGANIAVETLNVEAPTLALKPLALIAPFALSACGGGGGAGGEADPDRLQAQGLAGSAAAEPAKVPGLSDIDASRLLTQATFGIRSLDEVRQLGAEGVEHWLWRQFNAPVDLHTAYLDAHRGVTAMAGSMSAPMTGPMNEPGEEQSYGALWRQWLFDEAGQLRARVAFALSQILVISNAASDIPPYALSSYMDVLNRHAFGNFRVLLRDVTLHPAMGCYLNMLQSRKEDPDTKIHPNENFAREILQLFTIGLVKLRDDGSTVLDQQGKPVPTYGQAEVKGLARALSGWSFGGERPVMGQAADELFDGSHVDNDANWQIPMRAYATFHDTGPKLLLDGATLPAGQTPEKDLNDALDHLFHHANVPPFICRQLIQRLVTSNPSPAYLSDVARVFKDNGQGVRGDLRAVVRAILVHPQARGDGAELANQGKLREPVIRFANFLRALNVKPKDAGSTSDFSTLFGTDMPLGQHPLLAPSVFNFYSPNFRPAGVIAQHGLVAPEFQIVNETTVLSTYNVFYDLMNGTDDQYGLTLDIASWQALARQPDKLVARLDATLFCHQMSADTRQRLLSMIQSMASADSWGDRQRVNAAFVLASVSPDFVIQK